MRDTLLFSKKKTQVAPRSSCYRQIPTFVRTKSRRACAKAVLRAAATLYDRAKLRSSGRIVVSVLASRDRFEVLGVRGDINKSTTFGTEDKCNPLEATIGAALRYQTLRSLTATEIGAGTVNVDKMVRGGVVVGPCSPSRPYFGPISAGGASQRSSWISREFVHCGRVKCSL